MRYWWLVVIFALAGGALSLAFALIRPKNYQSYAVLFYQERIRSSLLSNREEQVQRNIGDRYRELLLARGQLAQIVSDPALNPFPDEDDAELAIDKLREKVRFESRGANAFRMAWNTGFSRPSPSIAAHEVTGQQSLSCQTTAPEVTGASERNQSRAHVTAFAWFSCMAQCQVSMSCGTR